MASADENDFYAEVEGDLFSCSDNTSLAHCISADVHMGKGIAVMFKIKFGGVNDLIAQKVPVGGCATLKRGPRFVYYLVTKEKYWQKPTYDSLQQSLVAMATHCLDNNVSELAMPQIGCGLDGLQWPKVTAIIKEVFEDKKVKVTVYIFRAKAGQGRSAQVKRKAPGDRPLSAPGKDKGISQYFSSHKT